MATRVPEQQFVESVGPFAGLTDDLVRSCRSGRDAFSLPPGAPIGKTSGYAHFCLLVGGWAYRYVTWRRICHIVDVLLPGDIVGLPLLGGSPKLHPLRCLTEAKILALDVRAFGTWVRQCPGALDQFLQMRIEEEYRAQSRIMVLARLRPTARLCYLILDLRERLLSRGMPADEGFAFPLTYRQLAELVGASRSQTAASLAELRERGWANLKDGWISIEDAEQMLAACEFPAIGSPQADEAAWIRDDAADRRASFLLRQTEERGKPERRAARSYA